MYDDIKPGHEVKVHVAHYGYAGQDKPGDQSKIWVVLTSTSIQEEWGSMLSLGSGYIANPYPTDYFLDSEGQFKRTDLIGVITDSKVMEHSNGGRSNDKVYNSVADYISDPEVKKNVRRKCKASVFDIAPGDPDNVDILVKFRIQGPTSFPTVYEVKESLWQEIVPVEWYSEFHSDVITDLQTFDTYSTAQEAITETQVHEDLFGDRLFPVIKAPKELVEVIKDHSASFKNCSKPLFDDKFVYIGVRSKVSEIDEINDIYSSGGTILKHRDWDW